MRTLKISLLVFILSITISAQETGWFWQNPLPKGNNLNEIAMLLEKRIYHYEANNWVDDIKVIYTYDSLKLVNELQQVNNSGNWENEEQFLYTYELNKLFEKLDQNWDGANWINSWKYNYQYNLQYQKEVEITYQWDGNFWVRFDSAKSTYNTIDSLEYTYWFHWNGYEWRNRNWYMYSYDVGGLLIEFLNKKWIENSNQWENDWRYNYNYNTSYYLSEVVYQNWDINQWINGIKDSLIYDINYGMLIEKHIFDWQNFTWEKTKKHIYSYGWYGLIEEDIEYEWNGSEWIFFRKTNYEWIIVNIEREISIINDFSLSQNYPNPFNPGTVISYRLPVIGFVTLKIYDILGTEIATLVNEEKPAGEYEVEFDGSNFPSGIYFYQLKAGDFTETRKMVLLK